MAAVIAAAGLWLLLAAPLLGGGPFGDGLFRDVAGSARWNDPIAGTLLVAGAVLGRSRRHRRVRLVTGLIGCWLLVAPTVLGYDVAPGVRSATWNDVLAGGTVVLAAGLWWQLAPSRS